MSIIQAILLGIIQGLTEFLPVSSSAHLVLTPWWLGWEQPGLAFDTMLHWGTLLAVIVYFWRDWVELFQAGWARLRGRVDPNGRDKLLLALIIGTIPAAVIGYAFEDFFEGLFNQPVMVAVFMIITGFILVAAERLQRGDKPIERINMTDATVVGLAQAAAIIPGISRSGSTIAAGMMRGIRPSLRRPLFILVERAHYLWRRVTPAHEPHRNRR